MFTRFGVDILAEGVEPDKLNRQELGDAIFEKLLERYDAKEQLIGAEAMRHHERIIMLSVLDQLWKDHLLNMDHLKEGIGLRGYGQHDPLVEYKRESFEMFEAMMERFEEETVRYLYLMQVVDGDERIACASSRKRRSSRRVPGGSRLRDGGNGDDVQETPGTDFARRHGRGLPAQEAARTGAGAHGRRPATRNRCSRWCARRQGRAQ